MIPERLRAYVSRDAKSRAAFVVWVVAATLIAVPLLFTATSRLGPGTVSAQIRPAWSGTTELAIPPVGAVRAGTHAAPVGFRLELRELDVLDLVDRDQRPDVVTVEDSIPTIEAEVREELPSALRRLALTLAAVAATVGVVAALAFPGRRNPARLAAGAGIGLATIAVLVVPAAIGYDSTAFETEPEFTGTLASAEEIVARVGSLQTPLGSVESRSRILSAKIAGLYSATTNERIERSDGEVVLLHVSDLHLNGTGVSLAAQLARDFDVNAVIDTGDITSFGFAPESLFFDLFSDFDVPYYVVAGNHDAESIRTRLAESDDLTYLDDDTVDIDGVRVLGVGDPTVTALRTVPTDELDSTYRSQFDSTRSLVESERPDLLMVHNPVQARPVLGDVATVAAGHLHRSSIEVIDGTVVSVVGSSGATGLGDLLVEGDATYSFDLMRFVDGDLVAIDRIELKGSGGDFVLNRRLIDSTPTDTTDDVPDGLVDEPSLEEVERDDPDRFTTTTTSSRTSTTSSSSTSSTTATSTTEAPN